MKTVSVLVLGIAFAAGATAQSPVYKLQQPDGRTVYSDKVLPNTQLKKDLSGAELNVATPLASTLETQQTDARLNERVARRDALWRARNLALAELDAARAARVSGEEPMPGERSGAAGGRSRLNGAYWARQDQLQRQIDQAQRRLEQAERNLREFGS